MCTKRSAQSRLILAFIRTLRWEDEHHVAVVQGSEPRQVKLVSLRPSVRSADRGGREQSDTETTFDHALGCGDVVKGP